MSDLREIQKPTPVSAIKVYAENFKGSITGEAFNDLFEYISEKESEIERLRVALKDTLSMISQSDQMSKCDQRVWSEYVELSKGIKGGETDATQTSD